MGGTVAVLKVKVATAGPRAAEITVPHTAARQRFFVRVFRRPIRGRAAIAVTDIGSLGRARPHGRKRAPPDIAEFRPIVVAVAPGPVRVTGPAPEAVTAQTDIDAVVPDGPGPSPVAPGKVAVAIDVVAGVGPKRDGVRRVAPAADGRPVGVGLAPRPRRGEGQRDGGRRRAVAGPRPRGKMEVISRRVGRDAARRAPVAVGAAGRYGESRER